MVFERCKAVLEGGNASEILELCPFTGGMVGGALMALGIMILAVFMIGLYVYFSLAWYTIAKKLKNKNAWVAWIPIANIGLILQLGGFHWVWIFLILIPFLGWIALGVLILKKESILDGLVFQ